MDIHETRRRRKQAMQESKVAKNDTIATGNSEASIFRQHGGKEAYSGMLLEPKHGGVLGIGIGQGFGLDGDQSLGGFTFDMDLRLFSSWKIGFNTVSNNFSITDFGGLNRDSIFYTSDSTDYAFGGNLIANGTSVSGSTGFFNFNFGREFCIGDRGNLVIEPKIGTGFAKYVFNTNAAPDTMQNVIQFLLFTIYITGIKVSFVIGNRYHIHPNIVVSLKPIRVKRDVYTTNATMGNENSPTNYRNVNALTRKLGT